MRSGVTRLYIFTDPEKVTYENDISVTEAKTISDAYLYLYAREGKQMPHVRIRTGKGDKKDKWLGDVYSGVAISPTAATSELLDNGKLTGQIAWAYGPTNSES